MRDTTRVIQSFQAIISQAPPNVRNRIEVPDDLIRAWLHLIMGLIQISLNYQAWDENMNVADGLIRRGMDEIINKLSTRSLLDYSVVLPMDLVVLFSSRLLRNFTGKFPNINKTYSDYLKGLEHNITKLNSNRAYQLRLTLFRQEVSAIRSVIKSQMEAIAAINGVLKLNWNEHTSSEREMVGRERDKSKTDRTTRVYFPERQEAVSVDRPIATDHFMRDLNGFGQSFSKLSATDPGGFSELFGRECGACVDRRDREFYELSIAASRLVITNTNNIEVTKDRQEAAVYAFTMVTIIFLPLGTISSIFGMNSSDVRDMEAGQWAYWATAVPTTLLVIVAGLWWMGELRNLVDWVRGLAFSPPSRRSSGKYREELPPTGVVWQSPLHIRYTNRPPPPLPSPPPPPGMFPPRPLARPPSGHGPSGRYGHHGVQGGGYGGRSDRARRRAAVSYAAGRRRRFPNQPQITPYSLPARPGSPPMLQEFPTWRD
ncbi:hypothetical protein F4809DRAFT_513097 [Biscogniauxia mediterranea]|nr:hypothetical protein F4809DRAFT_513097 [Biscogniauxia mediterranea]